MFQTHWPAFYSFCSCYFERSPFPWWLCRSSHCFHGWIGSSFLSGMPWVLGRDDDKFSAQLVWFCMDSPGQMFMPRMWELSHWKFWTIFIQYGADGVDFYLFWKGGSDQKLLSDLLMCPVPVSPHMIFPFLIKGIIMYYKNEPIDVIQHKCSGR